ncbi:MAG: PorV/PorQ family protein [Candidatus Cloacimonetes bacterium]|nr:PorV/PorQ family protein [Candidatus Cloacimonadota bacterium]MBL7085756.1 PorV/PorQ family protein [Candidatus Cloacimonadota bacterium]
MKAILCIVIVLLFVQPIFAINSNAGTSAFNFLKIPIGPRGSAMANAFQGLSDDELAPFWNPAGLPQVKNKKLEITYLNYFVGFNGGAASFVLPLSEKSTMAIFSKFVGVGDIPKTDIAPDDPDDYIELGTYGTYDVLLGLSYGEILSEILNWGINIKFISETIDEYSSQAIAVDICILHQTPNPKLKIGIVAKNFGKQLTKFDSEQEKLPLFFAVGFAYHMNNGVLTFDLNKPLENDFYGAFGFETNIRDNLILRVGYRSNARDWNVGSKIDFLSGISAGFGFGWKEYHFDYAINSFGELGFIHQLSVGYNF